MTKEIEEKAATVAMATIVIRKQFPEFKLEIDRMLFDISVNYLDACGQEECICTQITFEEFHKEMTKNYG